MKSKRFDSYLQCLNFRTFADNHALGGIIFGLIYEFEEKLREKLTKKDYENSIFMSMINPHFDGFRNVAFALFFRDYKSSGEYKYAVLQYQNECYNKEKQKFAKGFSQKPICGRFNSLEQVKELSDEIYGSNNLDELKHKIENYQNKTMENNNGE